MLDQMPLFANVPAKDFERAKRWYEEKLGLTPSVDMGPGGAVYTPGGVTFLLYQTEFAGTGKHTIGTFVVGDIDEAVAAMRAKASCSRITRWATRARIPWTASTAARETAAGRRGSRTARTTSSP